MSIDTSQNSMDVDVACTIVARNYLGRAEVLARSYREHHPASRFVTLVIDAVDKVPSVPNSDVITPADLGLPDGEWQLMAAMYSVMEFATSLKAALLRHLLQAPARTATYLDPDMLFLDSIDGALDLAATAGIALTPHVVEPMPRDGLQPDERALRHAGIFNLGFISVGQAGLGFLRWWHERLITEAVVDLPNALFTDQRWIDWVPALYAPAVIRDKGYNVAYWNLHERPLQRIDGVLCAADAPVKFIHFSGLDPANPAQLSKHAQPNPRVRLVDHPLLAEICHHYGQLITTADARYDRVTNDGAGNDGAGNDWLDYGWTFLCGDATTGIRADPIVRSAIRQGAQHDAATLAVILGSLHDSAQRTPLANWLDEPFDTRFATPISRWDHAVYQSRSDVVAAFPNLLGNDAHRLRHWLDTDDYPRQLRDASGMPAPPRSVPPRRARQRVAGGWNVVGYARADLGVGESVRRMVKVLDAAGVPYRVVPLSVETTRDEQSIAGCISDHLHFRNTIYCVNADTLAHAIARLEHPADDRADDRGDARRIGMWYWELEDLHPTALNAIPLLDELWVATDFIRDAVTKVSNIPVHVITPPAITPATRYRDRSALGLPGGPLFTFVFDFNSIPARKNPEGVIDAFIRAFPTPHAAHLVLKSMNGRGHPQAFDQVRHRVAGRPDIQLIDEHWSTDDVHSLIACSEAFVSLHRSEGLGNNLSDAMALGTPTIATGYSGNLQFSSDTTALLVDHAMVPVGPGSEPYMPTSLWAEPDVEHAATLMRLVVEQPAQMAALAQRAQAHVQSVQSMGKAASAVRAALLPLLCGPREGSAG